MNQQNNETLDIREWRWDDFMRVFDAVSALLGAEDAWKMVHVLWRIRAGEPLAPDENGAECVKVISRVNLEPVGKLDLDISELNLSVRSYNALWQAGIRKIRHLHELTTLRDFDEIKNLGLKSREEILYAMREAGFSVWFDKMCKKISNKKEETVI